MQQFEDIDSLRTFVSAHKIIENIAVQSLDMSLLEYEILNTSFSKSLFLGCKMTPRIVAHLVSDNFIFPLLDMSFNSYPNKLYDSDTLYSGFNHHVRESYGETYDKKVYDYYQRALKKPTIKDTLAQRLHDHSITDALSDYLSSIPERKRIAVMGGHKMSRTDKSYRQIVDLSKELTEKGFLMLSGGGPGAMEATHLGAWFAGKSVSESEEALRMLAVAPFFSDPDWLVSAFRVIEKFPNPHFDSLGIPTWHYGHEYPTPFATHIAKYFENSVREEGLLALAKGGVVFSPGSAGTMQEVFQDLAQNHYESYGYASPMIFLDSDYWVHSRPLYPLIKKMQQKGDLLHLDLGLYDENKDIIAHLMRFLKAG